MTNKPDKESFDPHEFLAKVGTGKTITKYRKDQIVYSQGERADAVFYIQKGRIKVVVLSEQAKEAVVGILETGQFFGEGCLNGQELRIATTIAMEASVVTVITKPAMIALLHGEPKFSELFVAYLLSRNSRIEEDLIDQLSIRARSVSPGFFFCWRILARTAIRRLSIQMSVRRRWPI